MKRSLLQNREGLARGWRRFEESSQIRMAARLVAACSPVYRVVA